MAEVREFALPDLGEGLTEATIVRWLVEIGEVVAVDQTVVEVETAKALVEVPCPYEGVVTARLGDEGEELPVGAPLLTVAVGESAMPPGEPSGGVAGGAADSGGAVGAGSGVGSASGVGAASGVRSASGGGGGAASGGTAVRGAGAASGGASVNGRAPQGTAGTSADEGSGNVLVGYGTTAATGRRRRTRPVAPHPVGETARPTAPEAPSTRWSGTAAIAPEVQQVTAPASRTAPHGGGVRGAVAVISPLVRRLAREYGLDLRDVRGTGPEGLILRADVERAARERESAPTGAPMAAGTATVVAEPAGQPVTYGRLPGEAERIPLRGMRGAAAEKFRRSRHEIPDASCWVDADATELLAARKAMNVPGAPKVSLLALLARVCTAALARYPMLNSTVDTETNEIVRLSGIHLGFAAQTDRGLVVPVVRDAQARTVEGLSEEIARLTESARNGLLTLAELTHGTFTLNNYGVFGVDGSTPIINHPEAAMLGVGRITPKPWVVDGELAVRQVVQLSLTFDHRVCDGGTAGGFLRFVADCVERPALLLRGL
ncbi:dihydrolipoamide acetyltransferase family protein [Streptomyces sp. NPDC003077]|uniref:dihydrolipoamide acetyltransferase family protein n=1 Tax=Streptomyces sp. NPDC003077 TaxID=3154443 RepID=UPI0033BC70C3